MTLFLTILAVYFAEKFKPFNYPKYIHIPLENWFSYIENKFDSGTNKDGIFAWLVAVFLPTLLTLWIVVCLYDIAYFLGVIFSALVLYFAVGFNFVCSRFYLKIKKNLKQLYYINSNKNNGNSKRKTDAEIAKQNQHLLKESRRLLAAWLGENSNFANNITKFSQAANSANLMANLFKQNKDKDKDSEDKNSKENIKENSNDNKNPQKEPKFISDFSRLPQHKISLISTMGSLLMSQRHWFGTLLWFICFGAVGVVFYRLSLAAGQFWKNKQNDSLFSNFAAKVNDFVDGVSQYLTSLIFALVGNFSPAIFGLNYILNNQQSLKINACFENTLIWNSANGALNYFSDDFHEANKNNINIKLMQRCENLIWKSFMFIFIVLLIFAVMEIAQNLLLLI